MTHQTTSDGITRHKILIAPDGLYRLAEVLNEIPVSKPTWYLGINQGRFPRPLKIGRTSVWLGSDLLAVIAHAKACRSATEL